MLGRSDGVLWVQRHVHFALWAYETSIFRNPGGVRFGSAELYDVIELCFSPEVTHHSHTIVDCLAVGQSIAQGADERVILFVKLLEGEGLTEELENRIRREIRARRTARHVPCKVSRVLERVHPQATAPACGASERGRVVFLTSDTAQVIQVQDIPYTINGKRVEVPVKKVRPPRSARVPGGRVWMRHGSPPLIRS